MPFITRLRGSNPRAYGLLITTIGILLLCPDTLLIRLIQREGFSDPWTLLMWRGILNGVGMFILYFMFEGRQALQGFTSMGWHGIAVSVVWAAQAVCFLLALSWTTVAATLMIVATAPFFAAILARIFLGRTAPLRTWVAICVAMVGIALIFSGEDDQGIGSAAGNLAALGTAFGLAVSFVILEGRRELNMIPATAAGYVLSGLVVIPFTSAVVTTVLGYSLVIFLCFVLLPLSFAMITLGPRYIPAADVSLLFLLETVFGPFLVWLALGEEPGVMTIIGGTIVVAALFLNAVLGLRKLPSTTA